MLSHIRAGLGYGYPWHCVLWFATGWLALCDLRPLVKHPAYDEEYVEVGWFTALYYLYGGGLVYGYVPCPWCLHRYRHGHPIFQPAYLQEAYDRCDRQTS